MLEPKELWQEIERVTSSALAGGMLHSIATDYQTIEEKGIQFQVRTLHRQLERKKEAHQEQPEDFNPFLPCDPDLLVGDLSLSHRCVLNKFNVIDHHLLIVTREFEEQEELLTAADFAALASCLAGIDGLAFYNAGVIAGASQRHKHLQIVPPLGPDSRRAPIEQLLMTRLSHAAKPSGGDSVQIATVPGIGFAHGLVGLAPKSTTPRNVAATMLKSYLALAAALGCSKPPAPYNLLVTRDWMLLVPRGSEHFQSISINALGFAGSLLVRNDIELAAVREAGPLACIDDRA